MSIIPQEHIKRFIAKAKEVFTNVSSQRHNSFAYLVEKFAESKRDVILISKAKFSDKNDKKHEIFERFVLEYIGNTNTSVSSDVDSDVLEYLEEYEDTNDAISIEDDEESGVEWLYDDTNKVWIDKETYLCYVHRNIEEQPIGLMSCTDGRIIPLKSKKTMVEDTPKMGTPQYILKLQNGETYTLTNAVNMSYNRLWDVYKKFLEENPRLKGETNLPTKKGTCYKGYLIKILWRNDISDRQCLQLFGTK